MGKKNTTLVLCISVIVLLLVSQSFVGVLHSKNYTGKDSTTCGVKVISKPNGKKSHFFGLNCSACHGENKKGKGCFTISGSVLNEERSNIFKNPIIKLYTEPKGAGKLVATILGDANGNFYSTENIDFSNGLYPTLIGSANATEPIKHMTVPIYSDMTQCNKCHGYRKEEEALGID